MKRIVVLALFVVLAAGWWTPIEAQDAALSKSDRQTEKLAQRQQKALYEYQKKQQKAQEKAQRTAEKQQRKAAKKYEKEQRKLLKRSNLPAKRRRRSGQRDATALSRFIDAAYSDHLSESRGR